ncbi:hypothetical protein AQI95_35905 [Streptomyces yokosukanensis]|uniref:DUF317 domain-containing protein n=1 Tax=Streptomyces yokosukanensis TaxID=67386 RepID=A0A101NVA5_9ACTN|nr:DUF317 domain-containing protein [Streptomyces yokosukanensis]KUM99904.1 hypothetical protein AQI95_35905 [Streptomyces yokosukanensis]
MPHDHAPAADGEILLSPRYLAASYPEEHHALLAAFADEAAWSASLGESSFSVTSPCERLTIRHDRTTEGNGPHLVITARTDKDAPERWRADVAGLVPVEFVASLINTVATGLKADPDHAIYGIGTEPDLIELHVDPSHWDYIEDLGLTGFQSHDGHAAVLGRPPGSLGPPLQDDEAIIWHIGAYPDDLGPLWAVSFTEKTPPFVVNVVLAQTLSTAPIHRPTTSVLPEALAPLVSARWTPPAPRHPTAQPRPAHGLPGGPGTSRSPRTH